MIGKRVETFNQALANSRGKLTIVNCKDCPFCIGDTSSSCQLSATYRNGGGVEWKYVHGNSAPPGWCPIRKYNGIELTVEVEPSPDHWHHG